MLKLQCDAIQKKTVSLNPSVTIHTTLFLIYLASKMEITYMGMRSYLTSITLIVIPIGLCRIGQGFLIRRMI